MDKIAALTEILTQDPANAFARYGLAMEHLGKGDTDAALREFQTLREHQPDYVPGHQMAAQTLIKLGRYSEARERLEAGLAAAEKTGNGHALSELSGLLADLP
ncbi:tetratricopeptide repeat protein [Terriglobus albidus]|uniref:Tetratricopeptide repeat protein n=1 Tax=Terriglobus albidus TaxID=1592106 RepID=A0A5B9E8V8_9BACT|nr:tetratricopeptide repeat protein [Terriglobus albidus]QEE28672.1 tetratricopeptide repeat protein [Terriglobus albidus]